MNLKNIYTFAETRNILHEKSELAADEGIKGTLLSRRGLVSSMYDLSQTLLMKVNQYPSVQSCMFEYLIYSAIGFVGTLLALEIGWHFTACSIHDKTMKPCMFKQVKLALVSA